MRLSRQTCHLPSSLIQSTPVFRQNRTHHRVLAELENMDVSVERLHDIISCSLCDAQTVASFRDFYGNSLLHCALLQDVSAEVLDFLIEAYPGVMATRNRNNDCPVEFALKLMDCRHPLYNTRCRNRIHRLHAQENRALANFSSAQKGLAMGHEVRHDIRAPLSPLVGVDDDVASMIFAYVKSAAFTSEDMKRVIRRNVTHLVEKSAPLSPNMTYLAVRSNESSEMLKLVIGASEASLTWKDQDGNMPLHYALQKNMRGNTQDDLEVVRVLIGDDSTAVLHENDALMSPLRIALRSGCGFDIINLLVSSHVDVVNLPRLGGFTELHKALVGPTVDLAVMQLMISKATRKTLLCVEGVSSTPLIIAMVFLDAHLQLYGTAVIKSLVAACTEAIGTFDKNQFYTPLHHVLMSSSFCDSTPAYDCALPLEIVELFITAHPQVLRIRDITGRIAADLVDTFPYPHTRDASVLELQKLFARLQPKHGAAERDADTLRLA